jgi:hypothetical protein
MNRHQRRALATKPQSADLREAVSGLGSLQELAKLVEQLRPVLDEAQQLSGKLEAAYSELQHVRDENVVMHAQLELQHETFVHLLAELTQMPVEKVLSMEAQIQERLAPQMGSNADQTSRTEHLSEASHPSAESAG